MADHLDLMKMENNFFESAFAELNMDIEKPPSLSDALWAAIPETARAEYLAHAALELRKGVHPDDSVAAKLAENNILVQQRDTPNQNLPIKPPKRPSLITKGKV